MIVEDLRVALFALYAVLIIWQGARADYFWYVIGFVALNTLIGVVERAYVWWGERRALRLFRRLDPYLREDVIRRLFFVNRQYVREYLEEEGGTERAGSVERFAFGTSDHRETTVAFWLLVCAAAAAWAALLFLQMPKLVAWLLWAGSGLFVVLLAWLRSQTRRLHTVLEISPFGLTEIHPDGSRRYVKWVQPLELRNHPKEHRIELAPPGSSDFIALDYDRVGFWRLVDLVFKYGGFEIQGAA
jgi:hypothetical protein